jgi:hypothetical protein
MAAVYQAFSRVCADVTDLKVVMGVNLGSSDLPAVRPLADELPDLPAVFLVPGPWSIISGGARRDTLTALGTILASRENPGDASIALMDAHDALVDAFVARTKAYSPVPELQSVLLTEGDGLSGVEWPIGSNRWHLAWPFQLQAKLNVVSVPQAQ